MNNDLVDLLLMYWKGIRLPIESASPPFASAGRRRRRPRKGKGKGKSEEWPVLPAYVY